MICATAFVPPVAMDEALQTLEAELPLELHPAIDWLEDNYIGRRQRRGNGRRDALFPMVMWNLHDRVLNDQCRTNNHAEAAHRRLQTQLCVDHPTLWKFINGLKKVQRERDIYFEQLLAGQEPPRKLLKYRRADANLETIVGRYAATPMRDYLRGIAHNT